MKNFRIIRNILIVLIIVIAMLYIFLIRSNNIYASTGYKLFKNMYDYNNINEKKKITMETTYSNESMNFIMIQATDDEAKKEVMYIATNYTDDVNPRGSIISIMTNENKKVYNIFPEEKKYRIIYENDAEKTTLYNEWISKYLFQLEKCDYYTKGYEFVDGELLYFENFKETNIKLYFDNGELIYMKSADLDESFDNIKNVLYHVKITYNDIYKQFVEIPNDYIEYKVNEVEN